MRAAAQPGALVLAQMDVVLGPNQANQGEAAYMVRTDGHWHCAFHVCGFLVESHRGPGGACIYDAVLSGPAAVLAWLQAQAGRAAAQDNSHHCQLHSHTLTLRIRWDALQSLPGIKALALAAPSAPLTTTEAARLKAFAASVAQGKQPRDLSQRACLASGHGHKAFLPLLVGDMLVAVGHMQAEGSHNGGPHSRQIPAQRTSKASCWPFRLPRRTTPKWAMPDLWYLRDPLATSKMVPESLSGACQPPLDRCTTSSTCSSSAGTTRLLMFGGFGDTSRASTDGHSLLSLSTAAS